MGIFISVFWSIVDWCRRTFVLAKGFFSVSSDCFTSPNLDLIACGRRSDCILRSGSFFTFHWLTTEWLSVDSNDARSCIVADWHNSFTWLDPVPLSIGSTDSIRCPHRSLPSCPPHGLFPCGSSLRVHHFYTVMGFSIILP